MLTDFGLCFCLCILNHLYKVSWCGHNATPGIGIGMVLVHIVSYLDYVDDKVKIYVWGEGLTDLTNPHTAPSALSRAWPLKLWGRKWVKLAETDLSERVNSEEKWERERGNRKHIFLAYPLWIIVLCTSCRWCILRVEPVWGLMWGWKLPPSTDSRYADPPEPKHRSPLWQI